MSVAILAFFFDAVIGDPRSRYHPVVLMGNMIALLDGVFYRKDDSDRKKFFFGAVLALTILFLSGTAASSLLYFTYWLRDYTDLWWLSYVLEALLLSFMIAPKSLAKAGDEIYKLLLNDDLTEARRKVGYIVGRDTEKLSPPEITRATVETIAENTVDGVISPLFFYALGGLPLAVLYRAANTMDSMLGYVEEPYKNIGFVPAKMDDVWNFIPARLTALLMILPQTLSTFRFSLFTFVWKYGRRHASPNSGYPEAALAGILDCRFGGSHYYFGQLFPKPYIGENDRPLTTDDMRKAVRVSRTSEVLAILILLAVYCIK